MLLVCSIADACQQSEQNGCCTQRDLYGVSLFASVSSPQPCQGKFLTAGQLLMGQRNCSKHVKPARLAGSCRSD